MSKFRPNPHVRPSATAEAPPRTRKHVLFVCIGNICRSPMAEALANTYGSDVLVARSAGMSPGLMPSPQTRKVLMEKKVDLGDHLPRPIAHLDMRDVDLVINMSGVRIPPTARTKVEEWTVTDPIGQSDEVYRQVRDDIEGRVMNLILRLRAGRF